MKRYVSARERLLILPEVFSDNTVARMFDLNSNEAAVLLSRWKAAGIIGSAGPRAGIYFNLVKNPNGAIEHVVDALLMVYPSSILCGESVLNAAGWTTQIPSSVSVAVLARRSYPSMYGFKIVGRPIGWMQKVHPFIIRPDDASFTTYGLPSLPPALALADILADQHEWHPDIDDLDIPKKSWKEIVNAFALMEVPLPEDYDHAAADALGGIQSRHSSAASRKRCKVS
jgi:hypothetical protein